MRASEKSVQQLIESTSLGAPENAVGSEVREAVILTIGATWNAPFELYAHCAVARAVGLPPATIDALASGNEPEQLSERARIARRFTLSLVTRHDVEDDLYDVTRTAFGDAGLVALTHLIGLYLSVSAVLKTFRVPAPEGASAS